MNNNIIKWIDEKNKHTNVNIEITKISNSNFWFYDLYNGRVINRKNSFFSIYGAEYIREDDFIVEQPIIIQNEIGYLGIVCKINDGMPYFYMQAKIEPGNVNVVQVSPTIQATKSNFTRTHGGSLPKHFEIFEKSNFDNVIYDQIQPEQSSRFYHKHNRNLIIKYDYNLNLVDNEDFKWISYCDLMKLFEIDNLINMDTRTVISGFPLNLVDKKFINEKWLSSINSNDIDNEINMVFHTIGNYSMFCSDRTILKPLYELRDWKINEDGIFCNSKSNFDVKYFDISISGREVQRWSQPLFCSKGSALFGLVLKKINGEYKILISIRKYIGSDTYEIAPTIQREYIENSSESNEIEMIFNKYLSEKRNIVNDVILSEEGGRFYHEQNRNVIIEIDDNVDLPDGYCFVSLGTIKKLICMTQLVNIQLRNLISIIDIFNNCGN